MWGHGMALVESGKCMYVGGTSHEVVGMTHEIGPSLLRTVMVEVRITPLGAHNLPLTNSLPTSSVATPRWTTNGGSEVKTKTHALSCSHGTCYKCLLSFALSNLQSIHTYWCGQLVNIFYQHWLLWVALTSQIGAKNVFICKSRSLVVHTSKCGWVINFLIHLEPTNHIDQRLLSHLLDRTT